MKVNGKPTAYSHDKLKITPNVYSLDLSPKSGHDNQTVMIPFDHIESKAVEIAVPKILSMVRTYPGTPINVI